MLHYTAALSVQLTRGYYDTFRSPDLGRVSGPRAASSRLQEQLAAAVARGTIVLQQLARVARLILPLRQWEPQQTQRC